MVEIKDEWIHHGVTYTVEKNKKTNEIYFKHPSKQATQDDHIGIEHINLGAMQATKEGSHD